MIIILPGEQPISWNKFYAGLHWAARKAEVDRVHQVVRAAIDPDWPMIERPVKITTTVYFKDRRTQLDCSNIAAKLYEDPLKGWLIMDDTPRWVTAVTTISLLDRDNPRVEILIEEVIE